jgi:hypothetical protein
MFRRALANRARHRAKTTKPSSSGSSGSIQHQKDDSPQCDKDAPPAEQTFAISIPRQLILEAMEPTGQNGAAVNGSQKYSKYPKHFLSQTFFMVLQLSN